MRIDLERAGRDCAVEVEVGVNDDPTQLGCPDYARGFAFRRATISPPIPQDWDGHREYLHTAFPRWSFLPGLAGGATG